MSANFMILSAYRLSKTMNATSQWWRQIYCMEPALWEAAISLEMETSAIVSGSGNDREEIAREFFDGTIETTKRSTETRSNWYGRWWFDGLATPPRSGLWFTKMAKLLLPNEAKAKEEKEVCKLFYHDPLNIDLINTKWSEPVDLLPEFKNQFRNCLYNACAFNMIIQWQIIVQYLSTPNIIPWHAWINSNLSIIHARISRHLV